MMMLIGRDTLHSNPTVQVPPWDTDPMDYNHTHSSFPYDDLEMAPYDDVLDYDDINIPLDAFSHDHFRMYDFKVKRCARGRSHDWTECPYAHRDEKARRRDPRKYHYSGNPCPDFRKGTCHRGDTCEYAHGVFECWLHPSRYRTQPCKDGVNCRRRICFFAHTPDQLRILPPSQNGPSQPEFCRRSVDSLVGKFLFGSSPTSTMYPPSCSPPMSPIGKNSVDELSSSVRNMHIGNGVRLGGSVFGSPRNMSTLRPGVASLPSTPRNATLPGVNPFDLWETMNEEEPVMQRVESGKDIRAKLYAKLSRENSFAGRVESGY